MYHSPLENNGYRPDIDGIRSLAVLSVIFFHLHHDFLPGGFLGVDVFFVVSGYLISGIILRENHRGTFRFRNFYARRVKRIFPALFAVLFLSAVVGTLLLHPLTYMNFVKSARYAAAQLANFFFASKVGYFDEGFAEQPLLHLWTLGVEEQFYLFWPLMIVLLFWLARRVLKKSPTEDKVKSDLRGAAGQSIPVVIQINRKIGAAFLVLMLISFIACYLLAKVNYNLAFYMFYSRAWEFCIGGFAALGVFRLTNSKKINSLISILGLILLIYSFIFIANDYLGTSFLRFGVILPCLGTVLIISAESSTGLANRILSTKIPRFVGKISYSLYLFHWPVIIFYKNFHVGGEIGFFAALVILLLSFLLATASYYLIEQPSRKTSWPDNRVLICAFFAIVVFASAFKGMESYDTASWRIERYDDLKHTMQRAIPIDCVTKVKPPVKYIECRTNKKREQPYVALVGDSHTIHYLKSTVAWARKAHYNVLYFSAAACPILLGDIHYTNNIHPEDEKRCGEALPFFENDIVNNDKVERILLAQRFDLLYNGKGYLANKDLTYYFKDANGKRIKDHTNYYRQQLAHTTEEIRKTGKDLIILKQVPIFPGNWDCEWQPRLKKWLTPENLCSYDEEFIAKWQNPSIAFIDDFIEKYHVDSFDPFPYLKKPRFRNTNLYENTDHLNGNGCHFLVPYFMNEMNAIMSKDKQSVQ